MTTDKTTLAVILFVILAPVVGVALDKYELVMQLATLAMMTASTGILLFKAFEKK